MAAQDKLNDDVSCISTTALMQKVNAAMQVIEQAVTKYNIDYMPLSFNGGKDCCVLLHLLYIVLSPKGLFSRLKILYFSHPNSFSEMNKFVTKCSDIYKLNLITLPPLSKDVLQKQVDALDMKAIFMGTRSTDPYSSHLEEFSLTDGDWPRIMRVNPIIQWTYDDVWKFILDMKVPYCELYDRGYTSLGTDKDTIPNPDLKLEDGKYSPAFKLVDGTKERAGRMNY